MRPQEAVSQNPLVPTLLTLVWLDELGGVAFHPPNLFTREEME